MEFKHFVHVFKGKSFSEWYTRLLSYLEYKEVDAVVEGTMPDTDPEYTNKNRLAKALILAALDDDHVRMVKKCHHASSMINILRDRYGNKSFLGQGHLFELLLKTRMEPSESARVYCDRFKMTLEDALDANVKIDHGFAVHQFLRSLDHRFDSFVHFQFHRLQNGYNADETTLPKIYTALLQQDTHVPYDTAAPAEPFNAASAMTPRRPRRNQAQPRNPVVSSYCNIRNHTEDVCRRKIADQRQQQQQQSGQNTGSSQRHVRYLTGPSEAPVEAPSTTDRTSGQQRQNTTRRNNLRPSNTNHASMMVYTSSFTLQTSTPSVPISSDWILDSGACDHYCNNAAWFTNLRPHDGAVRAANGEDMPIEGCGTVVLEMNTTAGIVKVTLDDVWYIPTIHFNLFSLPRVTERGFSIKFIRNACFIMRHDEVYAQGFKHNLLYTLDLANPLPISPDEPSRDFSNLSLATTPSADVWHARLGHISVKHMNKTRQYTNGIDIDDCKHQFCESCLAGKQS
ncbi:hypothetical protein AeRB84_011452 [Aphanomyces euteiches]|nr:hypothetical protein AeRB84_011452 [Aphanomyces euteiches]